MSGVGWCGGVGLGVGVMRRLFSSGADGGTAALPTGICIIKTKNLADILTKF